MSLRTREGLLNKTLTVSLLYSRSGISYLPSGVTLVCPILRNSQGTSRKLSLRSASWTSSLVYLPCDCLLLRGLRLRQSPQLVGVGPFAGSGEECEGVVWGRVLCLAGPCSRSNAHSTRKSGWTMQSEHDASGQSPQREGPKRKSACTYCRRTFIKPEHLHRHVRTRKSQILNMLELQHADTISRV